MAGARMRQMARAMGTILGLTQRGVFVPYRHIASVPRTPVPYAAFEEMMRAREGVFKGVLDQIAADMEALRAAYEGPLAPHRRNGYFGPLDSAVAFQMVRQHKPRRIVEVGSGVSTHVLSAAGATLATPLEIICIDPVPRAEISGLGVDFLADVLSDAHVGEFQRLQAGDIAFFDSSHVLIQGNDVDIIQNRLLPVLAPGVIVHVHDIFLPDPYPQVWEPRVYTEQQGLGGWLLAGAYETLFGCHYAAMRMEAAVRAALFGHLDDGENLGAGSIWMKRAG